MIHIKEVTKIYPSQKKQQEVAALNGVSLEIEQGDIFGIVGHSGAGKSTLLRLLNGLETPSAGSVMVDGKEISRLKNKELRQARQKIGMIFQHFHLLWSRTVRENIAFPLEVAGKPKREREEKVDQLLERVGLTERGDAYPSQLSGGQKQRVGIARALANDPAVLLCDEATSALDPETTASILRLLKEIHRETGITLVLITHEMSVVRAICNKMAVMESGKVVETGDVNMIFRHPKHPVTQQFVKELTLSSGSNPVKTDGNSLKIGLDQLPALQKIARSYSVSFHVIDGEIGADSEKNKVTVRITGEEQQVDKAIRHVNGEVITGV
ncbi:methionine ABC transporter ATP-binding protein [Paenactinomyces guangxiensis]|uniref:ATP-binding cassette domain-containing protein n=1 Tax=Paenactinomyces guangxiensis TaxID=1490290 RepID=A0A7W2A9Y7_9BACL|nr:ATP-binding cassette domain-containing protein [Paenactinomyces guangxiensis]MBA4495378.1 ATP-binding cassette domain-containing protein [Paenactinomyces guangxiensis]MBH8592501.1 ATP-binding cassette domain-containing protein [Paenactinomyces guangxiensis]